ncbi:transcriptional antiterminator of glycerol uptake operon [Gracilibacillus halophilus YIM-C55.5]|uniref:Glycerol uptake operon antiterminator regulatory protein n=1 Tax=Gracilibacillus halophilus YIM-C55.5 TaxID=1308866 RepID=N4WU32_9BACI|nr:glycerol-3-phosphate responsive antiterminator [Gracilibacillus halophilus]ENH97870.1 transcriptional antiterminator of glycerol uptake operon [Gracilibacillus halophilus YIM-C55.5]
MVEISGILPAIRNMKDFDSLIESDQPLLIILESRISQLHHVVNYAKKKGKQVLIHADLINGLKVDQYGMEYLIRLVKVDGVISTRANVISLAKKNGIVAIQRLFALDSVALESNMKLIQKTKPDYIEVLPGIMPSILEKVADQTGVPVIAGGLIRTREHVEDALASGATAVTTSNLDLWEVKK